MSSEIGLREVSYTELLRRNRDFRRMWLGQVVSQLGDWFDTIAVFTLALRLTGSGKAVGLLLVARFLPSVVLGPLAGVLADRYSRRSLMIWSDVLRAIVVLGFLFVRRPEHLWLLYALTVLQLALSTFFEPARTAAIPSIVSERELLPANALSSVTWSVMLMVGAAIGGGMTEVFGTDAAFVMDSISYLVSAVLIYGVRLPRRPPREKSRLTIARALGIADTLEGARYVRTRPRVLAFLLVKFAWGLGGGILTVLPVFGATVWPIGSHGVSGGIGALYAARGVGTAIGPIVARRISAGSRDTMTKFIGVGFLMGGMFYIAFGLATSFAVALTVLAIAHMGGSILWVFSTVMLQTTVEDAFRGRVFAAEFTLLTLALAASNYVTGEALDRFRYSPRAVAVGLGVLFLVPALVWFITRPWWDRAGDV